MIHIVQEVIPPSGRMDQMDGRGCRRISIDRGSRCIGSQDLETAGRGHMLTGRGTGRRETDRMLRSDSSLVSVVRQSVRRRMRYSPSDGQKHGTGSLMITLTSLFLRLQTSGPLSAFADRLQATAEAGVRWSYRSRVGE